MDPSLLCRLCAKEDRLCIQVFGPEGKKQGVAKKIRLCLPIVVKESDEFPKQICLNCLSNLDTSYELYMRCLGAESVIKNLMLVNVQSSGEMVKVYSTQELLSMMNNLQEKMCDKRPAVRLGNTVYRVQDGRSQPEVSSDDEQRAKKRKDESAKAGAQGVMYPVGQPYMLMPSAGGMIPSPVPHGHFGIAPMPAIRTIPIQAVRPTAISTAQEAAANAPAPVAPTVATTDTPGVQPSSTTTVTTASTAAPQLTSIQTAIQAFQSSSQVIAPLLTPPRFALDDTIGSTFTAPAASAQSTPLPEVASLQNATPVATNDPEEILPLTSSDTTSTAPPVITKRSPRSSPTSLQPSSSQSRRLMVNVNQASDDDDDEYAADDPDPLMDDSGPEEEDEEVAPVVEKSATEDTPNENREEDDVAVEELSSDDSVPAEPGANNRKCPFCNIYFPENMIFHHRRLHFRQKFFSCVMCNKNFRTEAGLETHRCEC